MSHLTPQLLLPCPGCCQLVPILSHRPCSKTVSSHRSLEEEGTGAFPALSYLPTQMLRSSKGVSQVELVSQRTGAATRENDTIPRHIKKPWEVSMVSCFRLKEGETRGTAWFLVIWAFRPRCGAGSGVVGLKSLRSCSLTKHCRASRCYLLWRLVRILRKHFQLRRSFP